MENEIVFAKFSVTCKTENCGNANIPIEVDAPEDNPIVICGVCALTITDVLPSANE